MPEHFNKQTVEATVWCAKCGKPTPHSIFDGRRGSCLFCLNKPLPEPEPPSTQGGLFE